MKRVVASTGPDKIVADTFTINKRPMTSAERKKQSETVVPRSSPRRATTVRKESNKKDDDASDATDSEDLAILSSGPRKKGSSSRRPKTSDDESDVISENGSGGGSESDESSYIQKRRRKRNKAERVESVAREEEEVDEDEESVGERHQRTGDSTVSLKEKQMEEHVIQLKLKLKKMTEEKAARDDVEFAEDTPDTQTMMAIGLAVKYTVFKGQKFIFGSPSLESACKAICRVMKKKESSAKHLGRVYRKHIQRVFNQQRSICSQAAKECFWSKLFCGL